MGGEPAVDKSLTGEWGFPILCGGIFKPTREESSRAKGSKANLSERTQSSRNNAHRSREEGREKKGGKGRNDRANLVNPARRVKNIPRWLVRDSGRERPQIPAGRARRGGEKGIAIRIDVKWGLPTYVRNVKVREKREHSDRPESDAFNGRLSRGIRPGTQTSSGLKDCFWKKTT